MDAWRGGRKATRALGLSGACTQLGRQARGDRCVSLFCGCNWLRVWSVSGHSGSGAADGALDGRLIREESLEESH